MALYGPNDAPPVTESRGLEWHLMTGSRDYPWGSEASSRHFIETVTGNWTCRLEKAERSHTTLDTFIQQVKGCISTGLRCVDPDPKKRPAAWDVIRMLDAGESTEACSGASRAPPICGRAPPPPPCPPCDPPCPAPCDPCPPCGPCTPWPVPTAKLAIRIQEFAVRVSLMQEVMVQY
ncbi:Cysteine-rich receptor-like protein kinase 26 [Panicum miliaceum]|uniref:Cysteine-rich receptor-like protein kinase 26 n=1 Tax=Panicum miliaceum TaxID=4540 RepID=A0A3L6PIB0_PANMI|nr:Cysteine-rich receptor-like protein kinase 26 [Panicum miliaceum]